MEKEYKKETYPIWHQMDAKGYEWDVWKPDNLLALVRRSKDCFKVTLNNGEMKEFSDLSDCMAWVCLRVREV